MLGLGRCNRDRSLCPSIGIFSGKFSILAYLATVIHIPSSLIGNMAKHQRDLPRPPPASAPAPLTYVMRRESILSDNTSLYSPVLMLEQVQYIPYQRLPVIYPTLLSIQPIFSVWLSQPRKQWHNICVLPD